MPGGSGITLSGGGESGHDEFMPRKAGQPLTYRCGQVSGVTHHFVAKSPPNISQIRFGKDDLPGGLRIMYGRFW